MRSERPGGNFTGRTGKKGDVVLEAEGECTVNGHALDALIQPKMAARYRFKYIYQVADETWVDVIRLRVN